MQSPKNLYLDIHTKDSTESNNEQSKLKPCNKLHQYYNTIVVYGLRPLASPQGGLGSGWSK